MQTDRQELVLHLSRLNAQRNGVTTIIHGKADWTEWTDRDRYDLIIGSDILYAKELHAPVRRIFEENLAPGGRVLIADPYRATSLAMLAEMERDGWTATLTKWTVGASPRAVGVFELLR